jgi:hypothetical protein
VGFKGTKIKDYMTKFLGRLSTVILMLLLAQAVLAQWRLFISNEVCMDYTWCLTEEQMKSCMADLIAAHLDLMAITDDQSWENKARYTCTTTNEIFFFLEKYPERKNELVGRLREGRIMLAPFLVNTMWGFTGSEGFLRAMYPAKRFAVANNVPLEHAVHSELPSMPWDIVPLLAGSGIRWISKPFLNYDATFAGLKNPPLFIWKGPDDSKIFTILDPVASLRFAYMQGGGLLKIPPFYKDTSTVASFWLSHYAVKENYPLRTILAEGTHCDLSPSSAAQAVSVSRKIIEHNQNGSGDITFVNSTFPMFADYVDSVQSESPFMKEIKGSFGHSWELWPLGMAKYAVDLRRGENALLTSESLLAGCKNIADDSVVIILHNRAEWLLGALQDHAWNGCNTENIILNSKIRKRFSEELIRLTDTLITIGFRKAGLKSSEGKLTVFNPTAFTREDIIEIPVTNREFMQVNKGKSRLPSQLISREGKNSVSFNTGIVPAYSFVTFSTDGFGVKSPRNSAKKPDVELSLRDSSHLDLINRKNGRLLTSLKLVWATSEGLSSGIPAIFESPQVISGGEVGKYYIVRGSLPYASLGIEVVVPQIGDDIRLNINIHKEINSGEEGIYLVCDLPFKSLIEAETTASITRPYSRPKGDLLSGADTTRIVIQGFVNALRDGEGGLLLASPDAFCLIPSDRAVIMELLGNNQNYREAIKDQNGEKDFTFRFGFLPYTGRIKATAACRFGRSFQMPLAVMPGWIKNDGNTEPFTVINAEVTCMKPADPSFGKGVIIRLRNPEEYNAVAEISGGSFTRATLTDLLEQDKEPLAFRNGKVNLAVRAKGFVTIRLE